MVKYKTILKIIENETRKTHFSLKNIKEQIKPLIHEITDNKEEEEILLDRISRFHKEFHHSPTEKMYLEGYTGNVYTEYGKGTTYEVPFPEDAKEEAKNEGLLLGMHNHPPDSAYFPSRGDVKIQGKYNEKYGIIVNKEGISIIKRTSEENLADDSSGRAGSLAVEIYQNKIMKMADETPQGKKLVEKQRELGLTDADLDEDFVSQYCKIEKQVILDNSDMLFSELNREWREESMNEHSAWNIPLEAHYTKWKSDEQLKKEARQQ